jgi:prephenate dehydrogenase
MKSAVAEWMKQLLPPKCHYVGLFPAINPSYILENRRGIEGAQIDLFTKGVMAITANKGTDSAAIKLAADFASIIGADPYFINMDELDIIHAYTHILPQLTTTALVNNSLRTNVWNDAKKIAGPIYSKATHPVINNDDAPAMIESIMQNKAMTIRVMDELIASLVEIRETISDGKAKKLRTWVEQAQESHMQWWEERKVGDWRTPKKDKSSIGISGLWKRLFGDIGKVFGVPKTDSEQGRNRQTDDTDE